MSTSPKHEVEEKRPGTKKNICCDSTYEFQEAAKWIFVDRTRSRVVASVGLTEKRHKQALRRWKCSIS